MNANNQFSSYIPAISDLGYTVWDIQHSTSASFRLEIQADDRREVLSGRADYLISLPDTTVACARCVIEIQSRDDLESCERQILAYIFLLMNTEGLGNLVGFLVRRDGNCRAFKATRNEEGGCVYHSNDIFHVCHIALMIRTIMATF